MGGEGAAKRKNNCVRTMVAAHDEIARVGHRCNGIQHVKNDFFRGNRQMEQRAQLSRQDKMQANQDRRLQEKMPMRTVGATLNRMRSDL